MERTLSVEEKIKKAEEIYRQRKNPGAKIETERVNINTNSYVKRKLKKIFIRMSICIIVYVILYSTDFGGTFLKQDTVNYIKTFLATDIDFQELYTSANEYIQSIIPKEESNEQNNVNSLEQNTEIVTNSIDGDTQVTTNSVDENSAVTPNEENLVVENEPNSINNEEITTQENSTSNVDIVDYEENIGGAIETDDEIIEEAVDSTLEEQKTQAEIDAEYILSKVSFIIPVENYQISSRYGLRNPTTASVPKNHTGIDLAAETGTKIVSATDGTVLLASSQGDYGNHLKIQIDDITIIYAHCDKLYVEEGQQIYQGQEIAEVGSTGNSTGPHLHFEIRVDGRVVDPEYILNFS